MDDKGDDPPHVKIQPVRHVERQIRRVRSMMEPGSTSRRLIVQVSPRMATITCWSASSGVRSTTTISFF